MKGPLFDNVPEELSEEVIETLCENDGVKIERILSRGHASPEGFWYDQAWNEFVLVVQGSAGLRIGNEKTVRVLNAGDHLNIGAHTRHRVEWTDPTCDTIWLAVHYP